MTDTYGVSTPLDPNVVLSTAMSPTSDKEKVKMRNVPYLAGVGPLIYTSMATQPDITFATNKLSQFNLNPGLITTTPMLLKTNQGLCTHSWWKEFPSPCWLHRL